MDAAAAVALVYLSGYVTGSLLVDGRDSLAWVVIRLVSGLLLTSIAYLASLVLGLPWFAGPAVLPIVAVGWQRRAAFLPPRLRLRVTSGGVASSALSLILVGPILLSAARMAPGPFPPVFFSVDNAYFMEQVHSLTAASAYPPGSRSNLGGARTYHYATHGLAAFVARATGLPAHRALYVVALPLLTLGLVAAALAASRAIAPAVPMVIALPLLLIQVPTFWYPFWGDIVEIFRSSEFSAAIAGIGERYEMWGVSRIEGQNVGSHFVTLAAVAGIASAAIRGWRLPVFLIGTAVIVKTSIGVALAAGFLLVELRRMVRERTWRPRVPAIAIVALCAVTYSLFWIAPDLPPDFSVERFMLFHLQRMSEREALGGLMMDVIWLGLPVAAIALVPARERPRRSGWLLLMAIAPLVVVNLTRAIDERPGGGGATDDWLQILSPVSILLHACVLAFASERWGTAARVLRTAVVVLLVLAFAPAALVAGRYTLVLMRTPEQGHEFADNRSIAEALAAIPRDGSLIVTNDLRYPAQNFNRENRQMQIPALFGHQAFAVNYAYEVFEFSRERRALQQELLQVGEWSDAILDAAAKYGWTHLLIHKQYIHPQPIPLERVFENGAYEVYLFGGRS